MRTRFSGSAFGALVGTLLLTGTLAAQQGTLVGRVTNESGEVVDQAQIQVLGGVQGTGTLSNAQGQYRLSLPAGTYTLIVSRIGSRQSSFDGVTVTAGATTTFDIVLPTQAELLDPVVVTASRGTAEKSTEAPATTYTVSAVEIEERPAQSLVDHLRTSPGVDVISEGIQSSNVVVRGFNNIFSGSLHMLTDYRLAGIPSLRVNLMHFIPANEEDVDHMEVVLGPGSALYGPNTANGVVHIITKSPLDEQGTTVTLGAGERSVFQGAFRSAFLLNERLGFKVSGQYLQGNEWEYNDATEIAARANATADPAACIADKELRGWDSGTAQTACGRLGIRDYDIERYGVEARADYRFADDGTVVGTYGRTSATGIELTGLGAGQTKDWIYQFYQARFNKGRFFAQAYYNTSDAGGSYLIREGTPLIDQSTMLVGQAQDGFSVLDGREDLTFGFDYFATRPDTKGTINGSYENKDDINEWGVYLQSKTALTDQVELVTALRMDSHSLLPDYVWSPRAGLVLRPNDDQSFRFTYNRAFSTPSTLNYFLDISGGAAPIVGQLGYTTRAFGTGPDGYSFQNPDGSLRGVRSPFNPAGPGALMPGPSVPLFWQAAVGVLAQKAATDPDYAPLAPLIPVLQGLSPTNADLGVMAYDLVTGGLTPLADTKIPDVPAIRESYTETFEAGWTGIIQDRVSISADVYRMTKNDFVSPLIIVTPLLTLNGQDIGAFIGGPVASAIAAQLIAGGLDPATAAAQAAAQAAVVVPQIASGLAGIPVGVVSSDQVAAQGSDIIVTYRNIGDVTVYGGDLSFQWFLNDDWTATGTYSYMNTDYFNAGALATYPIALNSPRNKGSLGLAYRNVRNGFTAGARMRFTGEFPAQSADYVGISCIKSLIDQGDCVKAYQIVDLNFGYKLPTMPATLQLVVNNVFDTGYASFVAVPEIGRFAMVRVRYELF